MFMDNNRRVNGAANPSATAKDEASEQRAQGRLSTNPDMPSGGEKRTFMPELPSPEEMNARIIARPFANDWDAPYEAYIPVGPKMGLGNAAGSGETAQDILPPMGKGKRK